ncbi:hypothetical protein [Streptomyces sp. NPDC049040]|uniref:hypothetical protein n=1 Tax=Streptomyces sp. NPDC049040 TaxID=3365593 RepID=UPI003711687A
MRVRTSSAGLVLMVSMTAVGCGSGDGRAGAEDRTAPPVAVSASAARNPGSTAPVPGDTPSAAAGKRVTYADLPTPSPAQQAAYLADLNAIDRAIVAGRPTQASLMSNSMGTCLELANHREPGRILTETIFALDNEQAQLTREEGTRIVEAIRRDLCPMY